MKFLILTLVSNLFLGITGTSNQRYFQQFRDWMDEYGIIYSSQQEQEYRYNIFQGNLDRILEHNEKDKNWKLHPNKWMDKTWEEFKQNRVSSQQQVEFFKKKKRYNIIYHNDTDNIPDTLDWREKNVVNPVKNQQNCGSCWAFSSISAIESASAIKTGKLQSLSEQELVDCSIGYGNMGCSGGFMDWAFDYAKSNSLCLESDYPYTAQDGLCQKNCVGVVQLKTYVDVAPNNETELQLAVLKQPVSVGIEADQWGFQFYHSGVFDGECGTSLNHGVVLDGYGIEDGKEYWLVRNSWGEEWGDGGYIKLARGIHQCGIDMMASYPIVS